MRVAYVYGAYVCIKAVQDSQTKDGGTYGFRIPPAPSSTSRRGRCRAVGRVHSRDRPGQACPDKRRVRTRRDHRHRHADPRRCASGRRCRWPGPGGDSGNWRGNRQRTAGEPAQVANYFNSVPAIGGNAAIFSDRGAVARPNLRSLPNITTSNGALTLVIVDGHRMVPSGISAGAGVDPDSVPPPLVLRVEAMPDGASAIYGSDAVGGVINYLTRDSFDGAQGNVRYGYSDGYESMDLAALGTDWGSGNVFGAVTGSYRDALFGRDRDYIQSIDWNPASPSYLQGNSNTCLNPNISIGTRIYPMTRARGSDTAPDDQRWRRQSVRRQRRLDDRAGAGELRLHGRCLAGPDRFASARSSRLGPASGKC